MRGIMKRLWRRFELWWVRSEPFLWLFAIMFAANLLFGAMLRHQMKLVISVQ